MFDGDAVDLKVYLIVLEWILWNLNDPEKMQIDIFSIVYHASKMNNQYFINITCKEATKKLYKRFLKLICEWWNIYTGISLEWLWTNTHSHVFLVDILFSNKAMKLSNHNCHEL